MNSWNEVLESLTPEELHLIYSLEYEEDVPLDKIADDVKDYFDNYVVNGVNCFGNVAPDKGYTKNNLMWALNLY